MGTPTGVMGISRISIVYLNYFVVKGYSYSKNGIIVKYILS